MEQSDINKAFKKLMNGGSVPSNVLKTLWKLCLHSLMVKEHISSRAEYKETPSYKEYDEFYYTNCVDCDKSFCNNRLDKFLCVMDMELTSYEAGMVISRSFIEPILNGNTFVSTCPYKEG